MPRKDRKLFYEIVLEQLNAEKESVDNDSTGTSSPKKYAESI